MVWLEVVVIALLILLNGLFALSELALVAARKARLQQRAEKGDRRARAALKLARAPDQFLSTVQVGITLVGILAGAFGGATLAGHLGARLKGVPLLAPYAEAAALILVVMTITYLSLVLGELVPKRLALHNPERAASAVAPLMLALSGAFRPVIRLLSASTGLVIRLLGVRPSAEPPVTEEEIQALLREGTAAGVFSEAERSMLQSVFQLNDLPVGALTTPRTEIDWLDVEDPPEETLRRVQESPHSVFPVARGNLDRVLGLVHAKDLLAHRLATGAVDLQAVLRPAHFIPQTVAISRLIPALRAWATNLVLVVDEYGGLGGLVTTRDILEHIVGSLEPTAPQAVRREDGSWLLDGMLPIGEFKEIFRLGELPGEEEGGYHTLAGFVLMQLGRVPSPADAFEWSGLKLEVVDMDGRRIDKVLVIPPPAKNGPSRNGRDSRGPEEGAE